MFAYSLYMIKAVLYYLRSPPHVHDFSDSYLRIFSGFIRRMVELAEFELRTAFMNENCMKTLEDSGVAQWERIRLIT